jgi:hypothetical protein
MFSFEDAFACSDITMMFADGFNHGCSATCRYLSRVSAKH